MAHAEREAFSHEDTYYVKRELSKYGHESPNGEESQVTGPGALPPMSPSRLLESTHAARPPSHLYTEDIPTADSMYLGLQQAELNGQPTSAHEPDPNFAAVANDLINATLGRVPDGKSVVEPDSILEESGCLYHGYKAGQYFLPNDAAEQDRLDLQSHLWLLMLDGWLHMAPMSEVPEYVLDIATGTGIWALEFAERHPTSKVIGTDLSAIQPNRNLPNCWFQKDDAEDEWVFPAPHPSGTVCSGPCEHRIEFDYIHLRMVATCFNDMRAVIQTAYDNLKPGGWIELQDGSFDLRQENGNYEGSPLYRWSDGCIRGAAVHGRDILLQGKYEGWLKEAGFIETRERQVIVPCNPWPKARKQKEMGHFQLKNLLDGMRGVGFKMMRAAGFSPEEIEQTVTEAKEYVSDCRNHVYGLGYVVYGRKPLEGEMVSK
ncbi:methyltransferase domain-containing protein [Seiridium cupressi]